MLITKPINPILKKNYLSIEPLISNKQQLCCLLNVNKKTNKPI